LLDNKYYIPINTKHQPIKWEKEKFIIPTDN
jgi:hypothetical protein